MHSSLISAMGAMMALNQPGVSFVAAAGAGYVASGTSISSPSSPSGIQNGDGLFAIVMARSALTPPVGWTLVDSQMNTDGTTQQTIYVYRKNTVTTGDSSTPFTWSQASAVRMGLAYVVVRSNTGTITVAESDTAENDYPVAVDYPQNVTIPVLSASGDGELFLIAATAQLATTSPGTNTWAAAAGATLRTAATQTDNRLIAATQARNNGQSNASPMTYDSTPGGNSQNWFTAITVRLRA